MALTAYCKKCNREVEPGDICPLCGTKLAKTATHAAWVLERNPVRDWMSWNAILRWLLPASLAVLILALILEGISSGLAGVERLFLGNFPLILLMLLGGLLLIVLLALMLQGKELMDYVVDSRGVHVTRYLPYPTAIKLLTRLKSPTLLREVDPDAETPILRLDSQELSWRNVARVQLWPEKCYILFYAPAWWLRVPVRCTPFSWEDALYYVRDKLGKKKAVELPEHLRVQTPAKAPARRVSTVRPVPKAAPRLAPAAAPRSDLVSARVSEAATDPAEVFQDVPWEEAAGDPFVPPDAPWEEDVGDSFVSPDAGEQLAMDLSPAGDETESEANQR